MKTIEERKSELRNALIEHNRQRTLLDEEGSYINFLENLLSKKVSATQFFLKFSLTEERKTEIAEIISNFSSTHKDALMAVIEARILVFEDKRKNLVKDLQSYHYNAHQIEMELESTKEELAYMDPIKNFIEKA